MGRPREHKGPTQARILDAASRALAEGGAGEVTVRRVADEAGTTTRAIYSLFGGKEGLLKALFHDAAELMTRRHEEVPPHDDPVEEFLALSNGYRRAALERPYSYGLLMTGVPGFTPDGDDRALLFRSFRRVLEALDRFGTAGKLGGRDPLLVGRELWGLVHGLSSLELRGMLGTKAEADAAWRDAIATTLRGYDAVPPLPASPRQARR